MLDNLRLVRRPRSTDFDETQIRDAQPQFGEDAQQEIDAFARNTTADVKKKRPARKLRQDAIRRFVGLGLGMEFRRQSERRFHQLRRIDQAMAKELKLGSRNTDKLPSVLLTKADHQKVTAELRVEAEKATRKGGRMTAKKLWQVYKKVYRRHPHWLEAIEPYFVGCD